MPNLLLWLIRSQIFIPVIFCLNYFPRYVNLRQVTSPLLTEHGDVYQPCQIHRSGRKHPKISNSDIFWLIFFPQSRDLEYVWLQLLSKTLLINQSSSCSLIYFTHHFRNFSISSSCTLHQVLCSPLFPSLK